MPQMEQIQFYISLKEINKTMNRKDFLHKIVRYGMLVLLGGLSFMLGKKLVYQKDCHSCPEYATCADTNNCKIELSK